MMYVIGTAMPAVRTDYWTDFIFSCLKKKKKKEIK